MNAVPHILLLPAHQIYIYIYIYFLKWFNYSAYQNKLLNFSLLMTGRGLRLS